jgi:hypothetical protein
MDALGVRIRKSGVEEKEKGGKKRKGVQTP